VSIDFYGLVLRRVLNGVLRGIGTVWGDENVDE